MHELDEHNRRGPKWYEIMRVDATAKTHAPRTERREHTYNADEACYSTPGKLAPGRNVS